MKPISDAEHMPQLDGLRAIAFIAVAVSHWTPNFLSGIVPWGTGVQLFFVLSGFLITGILLRNRPRDLGVSMPAVLRAFYARRFLRIFPLYYGALALAAIFSLGSIDQTWPWHVSYLSNFLFAWYGHADPVADPFLHFWSLAVEEQFYLVWPWMVLIASRRVLIGFLYSAIVGAVVFRVAVAHFAPAFVTVRYLTPSCFDAFGVGGLIAIVRQEKGARGTERLARILAAIGLVGLVVCTVPLPWLINPADAHRIGHTFLVVFYGAVVAQAAGGFGGVSGRLLSARPMVYIGTISYGLYVFHYFAPALTDRLAKYWGLSAAFSHDAIALPFFATLTLIAAMLSWHFYELPINRLKKHFPYPRSVAPRAAP